MEKDKDRMHKAYRAYLQTQCTYWSPNNEQFLAGEIVTQWSHREGVRHAMYSQQAEMAKIDGVLSGLLFDMKKKLSRLGRNGTWSAWLKQQEIPRATADRLVLEHAEYFDLKDELTHRAEAEPLEGRLCQYAYRTSERMQNMLKSPKSRMTFMKVLADMFGLEVRYGDTDSFQLAIPPPVDEASNSNRVPNVIEVQDDGTITPVDYELKEVEGAMEYPL